MVFIDDDFNMYIVYIGFEVMKKELANQEDNGDAFDD